MELVSKLRPAVPKILLVLIAGMLWSAVGIMLGAFAYSWLSPLTLAEALPPALAGIAIGVVVYSIGFYKLANKNIIRILGYDDKVCLFAFQAWKSYLIIALMVSMGIFLRHSVPDEYKRYLAILYLAMGGALLLSSLHYYRELATGHLAAGMDGESPEAELG